MLAGFLLTAIILGVLYYFLVTIYFHSPVVNEDTEEAITGQGTDTSQYTTVLNGMLKQIEEIEHQQISDGENLVSRYKGMIEDGQ